MTMNKALQSGDDVDLSLMSQEKNETGLAPYVVDGPIQGLEEYFKKSKEKQITADFNSNGNIWTKRKKKKNTKTRKLKWKEK